MASAKLLSIDDLQVGMTVLMSIDARDFQFIRADDSFVQALVERKPSLWRRLLGRR